MNNSMDLLAKLLATENLHIVRGQVPTASFDIKGRVLTLPQWKDMSIAVEEMMIGHEVGHALYTTDEYLKQERPMTRALHSYMNVIEDARIEKKIKNKYPGLRGSFTKGYKELHERDFFSIKDTDLSKLMLIDRINLYYKLGFNCGVKFTKDEAKYLPRIDKCDSIMDVYHLAVEMLDKAIEDKQIALDQLEDMPGEEEDGDGDNIVYVDENGMEIDPSESDETSSGAGGSMSSIRRKVVDADVESITDTSLRKRLEQQADRNTIIVQHNAKLIANSDVVVDYKTVLKELDDEYTKFRSGTVADRYWINNRLDSPEFIERNQKFKRESSRIVNYLVKEFEMKKSASNYKRSKISKSGEINTSKLFAYQLKDDIFKRVTVVPDGKNHGMLFLLDWSGSMDRVLHDTIKQVINLALFCNRARIAYQVFAFSDHYRREGVSSSYSDEYSDMPTIEDCKEKRLDGLMGEHFHLLELFSHKMKQSEVTDMVDFLLNQPWEWSRKYGLGSTPLNEGLLYMVDYIGEFKAKNNVEKVSFITLTDGDGHGIRGAKNYWDGAAHPSGGSRRVINYIRDAITRKEYEFPSYSGEQTKTLLKIIKDRHNVKVIGFHVIANVLRDLRNFVASNCNINRDYAYEAVIVDDLKKQIRKDDFAIVPDTGRDEMYVIPATKLETETKNLEVDKNMNSKQLAKQFAKFMDAKLTSRVLLNRFVKMIA